jgi:hypothetical protein
MEFHDGGCDCGGVRYRIEGARRDVWNCHCGRCRRITGHYLAATACTPDALAFTADATLRWYEPADLVFYGFCSNCGSTLFWKCGAQPDHISVAAGTLDDTSGLTTTRAWWAAEHQPYHPHVPDLIEFDYEG